jgi:hypothetical protein
MILGDQREGRKRKVPLLDCALKKVGQMWGRYTRLTKMEET